MIMPEDSSADAQHTDIEARARKRVHELRDFYSHLATYAIVNALLVGINLTTTPDPFWAIWPIIGWGIGLLSHAVSVFGLFGIGGREWEERKVRELMLQQSHLTADQVRDVLRQELPASQPLDTDRLIRRLEHLEAIVTSHDWDLLNDREPDDRRLDDRPASDDAAQEAERIARRVR